MKKYDIYISNMTGGATLNPTVIHKNNITNGGSASTGSTTTSSSHPTLHNGGSVGVSNSGTKIVLPTPPVGIPMIPITPVLPIDSGSMSSGGGGSDGGGKTADISAQSTSIGGHSMEIWGFSGLAVLAGAVGGYFIAKHYKKNKVLFASIGGVALGLATYGVTTVFVYPKEQKSGFLGFGKKHHTNKSKITPDFEGECYCNGVWAKECCNSKK